MGAISPREVHDRLQPFLKPIFGFALNRKGHRQEAEDLAQDILLELVKSMTAGAEVRHLEAYVWTVARYVWANRLKHAYAAPPAVDLNGVSELRLMDDAEDLSARVVRQESYQRLRKEIAYLSELQRRIVVLHYFHDMKQREIARSLHLPVGTVKWHLHEAKLELKKGMGAMRQPGALSLNPVRLKNMGHCGSLGQRGDTSDILRRSLSQNIAYAMYRSPMSVKELAEELGTPAAFVEDEVRWLVECDFAAEVSKGKFQSTHLILWNRSPEQRERGHQLYEACAAKLADRHLEAHLDAREAIMQTGLYIPDGDFNFLLWTLLPKNIEDQGRRALALPNDSAAAVPLRKDGGKYLAFAELETEETGPTPFDVRHRFGINGPMTRGSSNANLWAWQLNTYWCDRGGWRDFTTRDVELCFAFQRGELSDLDRNEEKYAQLLAKHYIRRTEDGFQFNALWVDSPDTYRKLQACLPDLSAIYKPAIATLYADMLELEMRNQPRHLEPALAHMTMLNTTGGSLIPYMLHRLLSSGKLTEPQPWQRKTVTLLMGLVR